MRIRWNWGLGIAMVYCAFASGTVGMVVVALQHPADLVTPDYYARSLEHDQRLAAIENTRSLGDAFQIQPRADGRVIEIAWSREVLPRAGEIVLYRPSDASRDRALAIAPDAIGRQIVGLDDVAPGLWRIQVRWTARDRAYYAESPVIVR